MYGQFLRARLDLETKIHLFPHKCLQEMQALTLAIIMTKILKKELKVNPKAVLGKYPFPQINHLMPSYPQTS